MLTIEPRSLLFAAALFLAGGSALAAAQAGPQLRWGVLAGGGGSAEATGVRLDGTLGQAAAGQASGEGVRLAAGFWPGPMRASSGAPTATATALSSASPTPGPSPTSIGPSPTPEEGATRTPMPLPACYLPRLLREP